MLPSHTIIAFVPVTLDAGHHLGQHNEVLIGGATLTVHALPEGVVLHIDDSGPGIPEAQLEQALEPWVRLSQDAAPPAHAMAGELAARTAGYGLGLAIARDLAERDGCRLSLHNRPEGGLRAQLLMPLAS